MFTANTLLSFLDHLVSALSIVLFVNLFVAIFYTSSSYDDDVNATTGYYNYYAASSDPTSSQFQLDISTIITIVTTTLHLISFLLWLNITLYYIGDITHYCTLIIELIVGGETKKRVGGVGVRRLLL